MDRTESLFKIVPKLLEIRYIQLFLKLPLSKEVKATLSHSQYATTEQ